MERTAPSSSISSDGVLARTARIKSLSIRAFKSFGADAQTFNFSTGFNLVVGANGSGKSNILDAICFVFCSKTLALRVGSVSELQSADTKEPCEVSLDLQMLGTSGKELDLINLSVRILPNDVRQYKLNGKLKSMKEVKDFLKEHRLLLDETSAVVHQSSVTELADKNSSLKLASIISAASGAGGQRTLLSLAFLLTVAISGQSPLYLLDEVDAALDEENQNRVAKLIKNIVSKGSQVICVSHHFSFQQQSDTVIQVTKADGTTKLHQIYAGS